jgi:hypothetical protein
MRKGRTVAAATAAAALGALVLGACGGEYRAERQGRQLGESICDIKSADDVQEAERQLDQATRDMNDLQRIVGRPIREDVSDIEENLRDLVEHTVDGNSALQEQDIAVIQRNIDAVQRTLDGKAEAAYDGFYDGLNDCGY